MGILSHINDSVRLNELINLFNKSNHQYKPIMKKTKQRLLASSNNAEDKARLLFEKIVDWQNTLTLARTDPNSTILYDKNKYQTFIESQNVVNKLKRKFNKMFLEELSPSRKLELAIEFIEGNEESLDEGSLSVSFMFLENFGYDENCFRAMTEFLDYDLLYFGPTDSNEEIVEFKDCNHTFPPLHYFHALEATAIQAPLSSNTWGYRGQEKTPLTQISKKSIEAAIYRREETYGKNDSIINQKLSKNAWLKELNVSDFKEKIIFARLGNGQFVQNCFEQGSDLFYRLTRQRTFDTISFCRILKKDGVPESEKGDHGFICAKRADDPTSFVLDPWNGAKMYPTDKMEKHLENYVGDIDANGKPLLRRYNPQTQYIDTLTYNIYPLEAFKRESRFFHPFLYSLLKEFHAIPSSKREDKMRKALEICSFIENKMPFYELYDRAIHDLYDQMMYLTAKERKKGLKPTVDYFDQLCPVNQALKKGDKKALKELLSNKEKMDSLTILHAIKTAMIEEDREFYEMVMQENPPIPYPQFMGQFGKTPQEALEALTQKLFKKSP